ncbi:similar to Saccharomyces cerevisiae YDL173W PAR32 Putative protein of unknown function [Maudiozyma barnettii]|mgnify:CR=1 FL=1|uniref:Protein PAR32 n=1 Tax=Maudiozyma barnettii TaxID=61262 RepID=A0A8H2ZFB8_9SACH|nr:Par32p [Kazachstania barnettii]CAB4252184.1 similar to Saccharomyces cerevisiae YDL173W PAR32 Putative protein of unknown function [Kazachstania barnettii]CAD1778787.1 similar to Saccharomyces cerevisiae YDL173W PAR32 Putative protein of unknown function [Kazachstania barnettii]
MPTQFKISTGRGGAGNIRSSNSKISPNYIKQGSQTPNILQPIYSTGRGGAGNMMKNYDPKLTRRAQDVDENTIADMKDIDEQIEIRNEIENINSHHSNHNHHGNDDDFISPIISSTENYVTNTISNVLSHISSGGDKSQKSNDSDTIIPTKSKIRVQHKKIKKQNPIIIGRGGAGNIVSPSSSSKSGSSHSKLNITGSKQHSNKSNHAIDNNNTSNNNIQNQKKKKKSFMSSIFGIFA